MNLPADNFMLLSVVNTALRDSYPSLAELCEEEGVDETELTSRLSKIGYFYDPAANAFK